MTYLIDGAKKAVFLEDDSFFDQKTWPEIKDAIFSGALKYIEVSPVGPILVEPSYPATKLLVLGGGHIAVPLVSWAAKVGFSVTVIDDRPEFAHKGRFPDAAGVVCGDFETLLEQIIFDPYTYIVVITRGHAHDLACLKKILGQNLPYIGLLGSKSRVRSIKEHLLNGGFSQDDLSALHAPIGLKIGAVTPEEISVSILAEVIKTKREVPFTLEKNTEFDLDMAAFLAKGFQGRAAVLNTIIGCEGSTPRKKGAKMLVFTDGSFLGTVGGGWVEAAIKDESLGLLKKMGLGQRAKPLPYKVLRFSLDAEQSSCGGSLEVLSEVLLS